MGFECSWPKQWQSGLRPRTSAVPIARLKRVNKAIAPIYPYQAKRAGMRQRPTAISAKGKRRAPSPASAFGKPKSTRDFREPGRSANFVIPASRKTPDKNKRPIKRTISIGLLKVHGELGRVIRVARFRTGCVPRRFFQKGYLK